MTNRRDYVTTAIVYPNAKIHVGWAWECVGADWYVRSLRLFQRPTWFVTGMDEHSLNVQRAAEARQLSPKAYCDEMAVGIQATLKRLGIAFDRFIRTSDEDHQRVVQAAIEKVTQQGDLYLADYEGLYCESCEAYYMEKDLTAEGFCPHHAKKPEWVSEKNYFFKLSRYQKDLEAFWEHHPDFLGPEQRRSEVFHLLKAGLRDFSISRSSLTWGIPLPQDPKQVVYVWFDALLNYLTAVGGEAVFCPRAEDPKLLEKKALFESAWPAKLHLVGKDIARFHCLYWPAMLLSLGLPLPQRVFAHGYLLNKGVRMSKTLGNQVDPDQVMHEVGPEAFRYFLLAENPFDKDGSFDEGALRLRYNADLANDFGNLVNRSLSMVRRYEGLLGLSGAAWKAPLQITHAEEVRSSFLALPHELQKALNEFAGAEYVSACLVRSRLLNLYIDRGKPWVLARSVGPEDLASLQELLWTLLEGLRWLILAWSAVLPFGMPQAFEQLGVQGQDWESFLRAGWPQMSWGAAVFRPLEPRPLYPRLELIETAKPVP